jgi:hypothetical protein
MTTYEALGFIRVVRRWHDMCADRVLRCFDKPEGMNYQALA